MSLKIPSGTKQTLFLCLFVLPLFGQPDLTTYGNQSPVVVGADATIRYQNTQRVERPIPESVVPLLAGLLLTNEVEDKAREQAILRWVDHYDKLTKRVNLITESNRRNRLLNWLKKGDLMRIDRDLGSNPDDHPLAGVFPAQFSKNFVTRGNQSPLIYGDGATVAYVVEQVITYQLPERISLNLLQQIEEAKAGNIAMAFSLEQERKLVQEWIAKYRTIAEELKKTPGAIAKRAYALFSEGRFAEAVTELHKLEGAMDQVARSSMLSARIALLQPVSKMNDKIVESIRRDFSRAVALRDSLNDYVVYANFLTNFLRDFQTAKSILDQARPLATTRVQNIQLAAGFCQIAFATADHQSLRKQATFGLNNLDQPTPSLSHYEQLTYRYRFYNDLSFSVFLAAQQLSNAAISRELNEIETSQREWLLDKLRVYDDKIDRLSDSINERYPTDSIQLLSALLTKDGNKVLHQQLLSDHEEATNAYRLLINRGRAVTDRFPEAWFPHYSNLKNNFQHSFLFSNDYTKTSQIVEEILAIQRKQVNHRAAGSYPQEIYPWLITRMSLALLNDDLVTAQAAIDSAVNELLYFVDATPLLPPYANLYWQLNRENQTKLYAFQGGVYPEPKELKAALDWRMSQYSVPPVELFNYLKSLSSLARVYLRYLMATADHKTVADQLFEINAHISTFIADHPAGKSMIDNHELNLMVSVASDLLHNRHHNEAADLLIECQSLLPEPGSDENGMNTAMIVPYLRLEIALLYAFDATKEARMRTEILEGSLKYNENFLSWGNAAPLHLARLYRIAMQEEIRLGNKKVAKENFQKLLATEKIVDESYPEQTLVRKGWDVWSVLNVRRDKGLNLIARANYLALYGKKKDFTCSSLREMVTKALKLLGPRQDKQTLKARADAQRILNVFADCK